jgi:hypothetical protein
VWELICHHTYDWHGMPIDRSPWHSDGAAFGTAPLTHEPGVRFLGPQSRISIERKAPWLVLRGIKIEIGVRLQSYPAGQQVLIAADGTFGMTMQHAVLYGFCGTDSVNTTSDTGGSPFVPVPLGGWVHLTFVHDGFSRMQLYIENKLVAKRQPTDSVPGVGVGGISIGNWLEMSSDYFRGDISSVKVWRIDPRTMWHDFAQRPIDEKAANCWYDFLLRIEEILRQHPECERELRSGVAAALDRVIRAVAAGGQAAWTQAAKFNEEYNRLWRAGTIDGAEMRDLAAAWIAWLRGLGIDPARDADLRALIESDCFRLMFETAPRLDCDPRFTEMLGMFARAYGAPKPTAAL